MLKLLAELGLPELPRHPPQVTWPPAQCVLVPYAANGMRLAENSTKPRMWLDLRPGAKVKLCKHHNHQGARQPNTIHVGSRSGQKFHKKPIPNAGQCPGNGTVVRREDETASIKLNIESAPMRLGIWWLDAAARGGPAMLPLVNQNPLFEDSPNPSETAAAAKAPAAKAAVAAVAAAAKLAKGSHNPSRASSRAS